MVVLINTSEVTEIGKKKVKSGEGEPLKLQPDGIDSSNVCAKRHRCAREADTARTANAVNTDDNRSSPHALRNALEKG
jgi:hypothetical protein